MCTSPNSTRSSPPCSPARSVAISERRMEISANFAFLKQEFLHASESATYAEHHVYGDPRASCFHARHALERLGQSVSTRSRRT